MKIAFFVLGFSLVYIATLFGAFSLALTEDGKKGDPFIFSHQKKQTFSLNPFVCLENGGKGNENTKKKRRVLMRTVEFYVLKFFPPWQPDQVKA